jgi:hypothetical protein
MNDRMPPVMAATEPGLLDRCVDPQALRTLLQPLAGDAVITQVVVSQARRSSSLHRHPHPLTACYELTLRPPAGALRSVRYYAKLHRPGTSATAHAEQAAQGGQALHLPELEMLLWPWPADPGLPQLPALLDPAQTQRFWGEPAAAVQALRHTPERRATLLYTRGGDAAQPERLVAKTFSDDRGAAIHARFEHFHVLAQIDERAPTVAEPLAYDPVLRTLWQPFAHGEPLATHMAAPMADQADALASRVAYAWATVHGAPAALAGAQVRDRAHWLRELQRRQVKIDRSAPALGERAARLVHTLTLASGQMPEPEPTLIHGDCHPDQLWVSGEQIVLFDFDEFALGDPMEDLAEFVTKLDAIEGGARFGTLMLASYAQLAAQHFSHRRLRWHMAVQQLLQATRAFIFQLPGWPELMAARLARAEALAPQAEQESTW